MNDPECPICNKIEDCRCSEDMYITALKEEIYLNESYQRDISWLQNEIKRLKRLNNEIRTRCEYGFDDCPKDRIQSAIEWLTKDNWLMNTLNIGPLLRILEGKS